MSTNYQDQITQLANEFALKAAIKYGQTKSSRKKRKSLWKQTGLPEYLRKYWTKRYLLFSKYDQGIQLDHESWYSVTPESIADYIASRCQCDIIVDAFCGAGSNAIQFALKCRRVIAVDVNPQKIKMAEHNAEVYGVRDKIEFICGDFFKIIPELKCVDVIFLAPPWGGIHYENIPTFDIQSRMTYDGIEVFKTAQQITENIAYYLPRNVDVDQLRSLAGPEGNFDAVRNKLSKNSKKAKAVTAFFGPLVNKNKEQVRPHPPKPRTNWQRERSLQKRILEKPEDYTNWIRKTSGLSRPQQRSHGSSGQYRQEDYINWERERYISPLSNPMFYGPYLVHRQQDYPNWMRERSYFLLLNPMLYPPYGTHRYQQEDYTNWARARSSYSLQRPNIPFGLNRHAPCWTLDPV